MTQQNYRYDAPHISPGGMNIFTLGRRDNPPPFITDCQSNDDIFENHSTYKKTFNGRQQTQRPSIQHQNNPYFEDYCQSNQNLDANWQSPRLNRQPIKEGYNAPPHPPNNFNHSISYQSFVDNHILKQQIRSDQLYSATKGSQRELAEIEHEMLQKKEHYEQLRKVQKNPTELDVAILKSEITEIQRSISQLNFADANAENDKPPATTVQYNSITHSMTRNHHTCLHCQCCSQREYYPLLESPTTKLLREPIDDSLV